jgi:hypothetical protein
MNKLVLIAMLFVSASTSAQQYRKFLFAFDIGYPKSQFGPIGSFSMEPGYRVTDKILIGYRMETIGFVSMIGANNISLSSMGINGQYYYSLSSVRPFFGMGIGLFNPSNNFIMSNTETQNQRNGLGIYPRIGLGVGHIRFMAEYNFIQKMSDYIPSHMIGTQGHYEQVNKSYLSFKIGFFFGGGRKKK